jgi:hypothetical protein
MGFGIKLKLLRIGLESKKQDVHCGGLLLRAGSGGEGVPGCKGSAWRWWTRSIFVEGCSFQAASPHFFVFAMVFLAVYMIGQMRALRLFQEVEDNSTASCSLLI